MAQVFDGLRVLDFTRGWSGAVGTMVMADNGADVVKIEPPDGDPYRSMPAFRQWHRGKKSIVLDLKTPEGQERAQRLAAGADVLVENFRPGVSERLGIGYDELSKINPRLLYCSITGFGPRGPYANYPGYDAIVQAKAGRMMDFGGGAGREGPVYTAQPIASYSASMMALQGILAALYVRERSGRGQRIETSLLESMSCYDMFNWLSIQLHERFPDVFPTPNISMGASLPYLVAPTADGHWLQFAHLPPHLFRNFCRLLGLEDVFEPSGMLAPGGIVSARAATEDLWELLLGTIQSKTLAEWMEIFLPDTNIGVERVRTTQEAMEHPQVLHKGYVADVVDPEVGPMKQLGPLIDFRQTPSTVGGAPPRLGQHTDEVLASLNGAPPQAAAPHANGLPKHALEGVTVLELAAYWAAPLSTSLLADLGANVIKVEPLDGDPMRSVMGTTQTVQGKRSLAIDLKTEEARNILYSLVEKADILMHNYRPGVPERLRMDYATLKKINPRLVYLYAGAYGATGPYADRPAFHVSFGAACGEVLNQSGRGTPPPPGTPMDMDEVKRLSLRLAKANMNSDPNTSMVIATALLMGLYHRERTGVSQDISTTMLGANCYANSDDFISYAGKPPRPEPDADLHGLNALYRLYQCGEGWVFLAAAEDAEWRRFCAAVGREDLGKLERFATKEARAQHDDELAAALADVFAKRSAAEWEKDLTSRDVACVVADAGRYYTFFNGDPQIDANDMATTVEHTAWGPYRRHTTRVRLSLTPGSVGPGNRIGEHTRDVLGELGYSDAEMQDLREKSVVTWPE